MQNHPIPNSETCHVTTNSGTNAPARGPGGHAMQRNTDAAPGFLRVEAGAGVASSIAAGRGGEAAVRASARVCHVSPEPQNGGVAR